MKTTGLFKVLVVTATAWVAAVFTFGIVGLRVNASPSLPVGLYIVTSDEKAKLAEFCPVEPFASFAAARGYRGSGNCPDGAAPLMKPVVATSGDVVEVSGHGIAVNGIAIPNTAPKIADTKNRPMYPWPSGRYMVSPESVWVASSYNERSFDSRYFGPIERKGIRRYLRPFLTL